MTDGRSFRFSLNDNTYLHVITNQNYFELLMVYQFLVAVMDFEKKIKVLEQLNNYYQHEYFKRRVCQ